MPDWQLKKHILQAAMCLLVVVAVLGAYVIWLMTWESDTLAQNPLNMRRSAAQADILRGSIFDAQGRALAQNRPDGSRSYPMGAAFAPVTGYIGEEIGSAG
ncbi:MAG: cell division protein FtsI, partial [Selenomonas sp.]|nr:cell division protein FtsI [Selenomonas sp.]